MNLKRKEIARRTGLSARSIQRNEGKLGLRDLRVRVNQRLVVYPERATLRMLRARGFEA
jgi:hypothetical protein